MRAKIFFWLQANPLLHKALVLLGGTGLAQFVGIAVMPILSRLYTPQDFAAIQLFLAFSSVALTIITLRYELAIPTPKGAREASYLFLASQLAALFLSPVAAWMLAQMILRNTFGFSVLPTWASWAMLVYLWLGALFFGLRYWLIRQEEFLLLGRVMVDRGVARALVQVALGWWPAGLLGMLLGELGGQLAGIRQMMLRNLGQLAENLRPLSVLGLGQQIRSYLQFPLYGLPSAFLDTLAQALPLFLISTLYGPVVAGYFALVQRAFAVPLTLLGQSVADSFHTALSKQLHTESAKIQTLFFATARTLTLVVLPLSLILAMLGLWLFPLLFGEPWRPAGEMALWMTPWLVVQLIVSPLSRLVFVLGGQQIKLVYDFTAVAATLLAYMVARKWDLPPLGFLKWLVLFEVLAYGLYYSLLSRLVRVRAPG